MLTREGRGAQAGESQGGKRRGEGEEIDKKGGGAGSSSLVNLYAMVMGVSHDDAPVAVDGNATIGVAELSVT